MRFLSRFTANKKAVMTIFCILIFGLITLCLLCYNFYVKLSNLTNPNYFPPEIETLLLTEINVSESEVLSSEYIKNVIKEVSEEKLDFTNHRGSVLADYKSLPNSLILLIDEFIDGFISRKKHKVTRDQLIADALRSFLKKPIQNPADILPVLYQ